MSRGTCIIVTVIEAQVHLYHSNRHGDQAHLHQSNRHGGQVHLHHRNLHLGQVHLHACIMMMLAIMMAVMGWVRGRMRGECGGNVALSPASGEGVWRGGGSHASAGNYSDHNIKQAGLGSKSKNKGRKGRTQAQPKKV